MKHKTIIDIALELNISPSTVSRALNNHPFTNEKTKKMVLRVAKRIGYVPNPIAQGLRKNKTNTIGVIVPEIKHDFFSSAISGIEDVAYRKGYTIIVCQSNESYDREVINTNALIQHRVAGIIVSISQTTSDGSHFQEAIKRGIPLIFFDRIIPSLNVHKVIIDDSKSAFNAVNYLIQKGYRKIAHFAGPKELDICVKRFSGYREALVSNKMPVDETFICYGGLHEQDGYESMDRLIKQKIKIDAIFAVNDPVAIGAFQRIKEAGIRIPEDIGIIGFSNNAITNLVDPPMTTVNQPSVEMGKRSAEILIELITNNEKIIEPATEVLEAELVIRKST